MDEAGALLLKDLQVPAELVKAYSSPDVDAMRDDFLSRAHSSLSSLGELIVDGNAGLRNQQFVKDALLALSAFACYSDEHTTPWTTPELRRVAEKLVDNLAAAALVLHGSSCTSREQLVLKHLYEVLVAVQKVLKAGSRSGSEQPFDTQRDILLAHQMAWILQQVKHPHLGENCEVVMPCLLTALDHFSPAVKRQAMNSLLHVAQAMTSTELRWYKDVVLDAVSHNLIGHEELWPLSVKLAVSLVTLIEGRNPRSPWYRKIFGEMLREVELHQSDKTWRLPWLQEVAPLIEAMGLVLVLYLDRLLSLFFYWLECCDDPTSLLVLKSLRLVIRVTWPRMRHHASRIWSELDKLCEQRKCEGRVHAIEEARSLLAHFLAGDFEGCCDYS